MRSTSRTLFLLLCFLPSFLAAQPPTLSKEVLELVAVDAPVVVLEHVRVIDGTGAAARDDQTVVISGGRIQSIGPAASMGKPAGAKEMDLSAKLIESVRGTVGLR
jgi:hypothetical protein